MTISPAPLEMWGGVECTVNRVGDRYFDQVRRSGHHARVDDLDLFASLQLRALRYPVLWERTAPHGLASADWSWPDERLEGIRARGIRPIVGLLHHGSGPPVTDLLHPDFPRAFAEYAAAVAARYPWIDLYTPINEPLTTARFSALYGFWYPHARTDRDFVRALLNQVVAIAQAMRVIRKVNPDAQLVQTEDAGRVTSTPALAYQARFENERRWLTFDLLTGRVNRDHPLRGWLGDVSGQGEVIEWLLDNPCPPSIVGLNYYLTSDRYLDERLEQYPASTHGGNGRHSYADVEAVRACGPGIAGHQRVLQDAWERYRLPLAITEVHAGCTREDQLRWHLEAWKGAHDARTAGADVRALTSWALLGAFDWNSLVVRQDGVYECGAFDVRSHPPRETAVGRLVRALATGGIAHQTADQPGWWRRDERFVYRRPDIRPRAAHRRPPRDRLVITGAAGTLGRALAAACTLRGLEFVPLTRGDADVTSSAGMQTIADLRPWAVINAAGYVRVDDAEFQRDACLRLNAEGAVRLATLCRTLGAAFVTFSTDLVFDGATRRPYVESDPPSPLNVYGSSKWEAERRVLACNRDALVFRTSAFFGPFDRYNFLTLALDALACGERFAAAEDQTISPTYVPELCEVTLDLLLDRERGVWHAANQGETSWYDFAVLGAEAAGLDPALIDPVAHDRLGQRAVRPSFSALTSERGLLLTTLDHAVQRYIREAGWLDRAPDAARASA
jgi:dTDP-4-dehydrorhamnose reductase